MASFPSDIFSPVALSCGPGSVRDYQYHVVGLFHSETKPQLPYACHRGFCIEPDAERKCACASTGRRGAIGSVCHALAFQRNALSIQEPRTLVMKSPTPTRIDRRSQRDPVTGFCLMRRFTDRQVQKCQPHLESMRLECLSGFKQRLQAGKNTRPSIGAGSVGGVVLGPLVMRHCYFGGLGFGHQFDRCA